MIDPSAIMQGIASILITDKVKPHVEKGVNDALNIDTGKSEKDILAEIHELLVLMYTTYKENLTNQEDLFSYVTIYKNEFGSPFQPSHKGRRQHFQLFGSTAILLNARGSALGGFNVTTKAADWLNIDFPDGTFYYLDATVGSNSVTFWLRETNAAVV